MTTTSERINTLLEDIRLLDQDRYELVQALRQMILGLNASVSEEVKYGGFFFSSSGKPFCGVFSYAKHVSLEFGAGAALMDEFRVLEGGGKYRRHIKLAHIDEISAKHVDDYLFQAIAASANA